MLCWGMAGPITPRVLRTPSICLVSVSGGQTRALCLNPQSLPTCLPSLPASQADSWQRAPLCRWTANDVLQIQSVLKITTPLIVTAWIWIPSRNSILGTKGPGRCILSRSHDSRVPPEAVGPLTQLDPRLYDGERWHRVELGSCTLQILLLRWGLRHTKVLALEQNSLVKDLWLEKPFEQLSKFPLNQCDPMRLLTTS
jgi:hypothetical protein